jgi:hypothetical protein
MDKTLRNPGNRASAWKRGVRFFKTIPGSRKDHFFLGIVGLDLVFFQISSSYGNFISEDVLFGFLLFDFFVIGVWGIDLFGRWREAESKWNFFQVYWYEIIGIFPFTFFRPFLLLRVLKIWLAYAKLFGKDKDVTKLTAQELSFRFKDLILDTISDAVFLKSLDRVEEVMVRLDYSTVSRRILQKHEATLLAEFNSSLKSKSVAGAMARIPILEGISRKMGEDFAKVFQEILETEVMGEIIKEFTHEILFQMSHHVKSLDVERIVGNTANQDPDTKFK